MKQLEKKFKFKGDEIANPPKNHLGAPVRKKTIEGYMMWTISSADYVKTAFKNVQDTIKDKRWKLPMNHLDTPMKPGYHPDLDDSEELNDDKRKTIKN